MKIEILAKQSPGLNMKDALALAKGRLMRLLTNVEHDLLLNGKEQEWKKFKEAYDSLLYWGCWTSTHIKYAKGATTAEVWNEGEAKHTTIENFHLNDGYYKVANKYGIPNGEPCSFNDPDARYLMRWQDRDFDGLVARWDDVWDGGGRRDVYCYLHPSLRLGVLGTSDGKRSDGKSAKCKGCGCTDDKACKDGCSWVEPGWCSKCEERLQNKVRQLRQKDAAKLCKLLRW